MRKETKFIAEVSYFTALGIVFDIICGALFSFAWLEGGSISIAMLPIYLMAFRWGLKGGVTTGVLIGVLQLIWAPGSYKIHWLQVLLDYPIAYGVVGLAGLFTKIITTSNNKKQILYIILAMVFSGLLRLLSHTISGLYFGLNWWGSFIYNVGYMGPSIIICVIILLLIFKRNEKLVINTEN